MMLGIYKHVSTTGLELYFQLRQLNFKMCFHYMIHGSTRLDSTFSAFPLPVIWYPVLIFQYQLSCRAKSGQGHKAIMQEQPHSENMALELSQHHQKCHPLDLIRCAHLLCGCPCCCQGQGQGLFFLPFGLLVVSDVARSCQHSVATMTRDSKGIAVLKWKSSPELPNQNVFLFYNPYPLNQNPL